MKILAAVFVGSVACLIAGAVLIRKALRWRP